MKSDREFLAGVWQKAEALEAEEQEKNAARRRSRRFVLERAVCILTFLVLFAVMLAVCLGGGTEFVHLLAGTAVLAGSVADSVLDRDGGNSEGEG